MLELLISYTRANIATVSRCWLEAVFELVDETKKFQSLLFWIIGSGRSRALSVTLVFVWGLFLVRQSWTQWCVQGRDLR